MYPVRFSAPPCCAIARRYTTIIHCVFCVPVVCSFKDMAELDPDSGLFFSGYKLFWVIFCTTVFVMLMAVWRSRLVMTIL